MNKLVKWAPSAPGGSFSRFPPHGPLMSLPFQTLKGKKRDGTPNPFHPPIPTDQTGGTERQTRFVSAVHPRRALETSKPTFSARCSVSMAEDTSWVWSASHSCFIREFSSPSYTGVRWESGGGWGEAHSADQRNELEKQGVRSSGWYTANKREREMVAFPLALVSRARKCIRREIRAK